MTNPRERQASATKRRRLGAAEFKLSAPERPGFVRRYVNDAGNRIQNFKEAGYDFVHDGETVANATGAATDSRVRQLVGTKENGAPLYAYLMEQNKEFYDEDQTAKAAQLDKTDATIRRGLVENANPKDAKSGAFFAGSKGRQIVVRTGATGRG